YGRGVSAGRGRARYPHRHRGRGLLRPGVPPRPRPHAADSLGAEILAGGDVLHAPQDGQPLLHVPVRRAAAAGHGDDDGAHVPVRGVRAEAMTSPLPDAWRRWDLHPSVLIGLAVLGGLYVFWGGLTAPRRRVAALAAGAIFTAPILAWHFPGAYNAALVHHDLHIIQHLVFLATAVVMWWPILAPLPAMRAPHPVQLIYLFLLGIPMSVVGALITLA